MCISMFIFKTPNSEIPITKLSDSIVHSQLATTRIITTIFPMQHAFNINNYIELLNTKLPYTFLITSLGLEE